MNDEKNPALGGDYWETPDDLFQKLNEEFNFVYDLCANPDGSNSKCPDWVYDIKTYVESNSLDQYDKEAYWMNPPYSRGNIDICMESAYKLSLKSKVVICLVRFDPSTKWFQEWVDGRATEVRMLARRVKFVGAPSAYNFPTCVVVFNEFNMKAYRSNGESTLYHIWDWK